MTNVKDLQGHALTGATQEAAERYEEAVRAFNIYVGDPLALADASIDLAPDFVMPRILKAALMALSTEPEATAAAASSLDELRSFTMNEREASHVAALGEIVKGNWSRAAVRLDFHSARHPRDLLALQTGHLADFFRADSRNLRDRINRALPAWSADMPGYSTVLGMSSFGLEETGDYVRAEDAGRLALDIDPLDCWAHHAVSHVMEMQGRAADGVAWMADREQYWAQPGNVFKVHNWWHRALFHVDLGERDIALEIYDANIRAPENNVALELVDAAAMLWRLELSGIDVGDRWTDVAERWDRHADGRCYAFNDWHGAMAKLGVGRIAEVEQLAASWRKLEAVSENDRWSQTIGLALVEGFLAWKTGDYATAVDRLHGVRHIANAFGGSHAQRDIIDWTLTDAANRSGDCDIAMAFARERVAVRPDGAINNGLLARALKLGGELEAAA